MKIFLDSSLLIYMNTMTNDERRHIEELFRKLLEEELFINMLVVDEVVYISRKYGIPYDATLIFLRSIILPYTEIIPIEEEDIRPFEEYLLKYDLRPSDALHLATMEKVGSNHIVTEDEEFDRVKEVERIWLNKGLDPQIF
ncbi:type II toxin-antitoxin system VapC family toxin [Candidatus Bathyarchaeota archaeon]|nr:type II toxin-antitoxin system VapC family toxin [Candidatus Bathyarchaeota archaeon]